MSAWIKPRGVLFDLDGVFYVGEQVIPGAQATLRRLEDKGVPHCFVTNTTTRTRQQLSQRLASLGLDISADAIVSAPAAACAFLKAHHIRRCRLVVADAVSSEFSEFSSDPDTPDAVIVGDIGKAWDYGLMNSLFNNLMNGAKLIALHKGKCWQTESGLQLDIGAFVAGLEYAAGVDAHVIGKPS